MASAQQKQQMKANIESLRVLDTLNEEQRSVTDNERRIRDKYSGWGQCSPLFDYRQRDSEVDLLRAELTQIVGDEGFYALQSAYLGQLST